MSNMKKTVKTVKAQNADNVKSSGDKVVVCLNLAHSLIFEKGDKKIYINGTNEALRGEKTGVLAVGKFGYTLIDRQDWEMIKTEWAEMAVIKNGFLFAEDDMESAKSAAKERKELRHGLEPIEVEDKK